MRPSTRRWLLALVAIALLGAAALRVAPINDARAEAHLTLPPLPKTVSSSALLTPLLAAGRAPLVDYLWLRATRLKDEGNVFDAYQLAQLICELQPKFPSVWAFQAWNMAYNISVTMKSPEERWRWVKNGYELLRDKGIPLNPNNTQLYRELAWILFHKVGDFMDEWQGYYKLQFALQMEDILGPPPAGYVRPGVVAGDYYRNYDYKALADAPTTIEGLFEKRGVADFASRLQAFGFDVKNPGVFLGLLDSLRDDKLDVPNVPAGQREDKLVALKALLTNERDEAARREIERYWRAYRVRTELKLDPATIVDINKQLGLVLDYRLPESHAFYWSTQGVEKGTGTRLNFDIHQLNTRRLEFFCLQKMFHRGRLAMSRNAKLGEPPLMQPDMRVAKVLFDAYVRDTEQFEKEKSKGPISSNFITGFVGFCRTAILRYSELDMKKEANEFFDYLRKNYPDPNGMYDHGLDGFLALQFKQDRDLYDYRTCLPRIQGLIRRALLAYSYDEDEDAVRFIKRAKQIYDVYQKTISSKRLRFSFTFPKIVETCTHELANELGSEAYLMVCRKLNIEPLKPNEEIPHLPASQPAEEEKVSEVRP